MITKYPGEWVRVGGQQARQWLVDGQADRPDMPELDAMPGCGIVLTGDAVTKPPGGLDLVRSAGPRLEFARTLLWSGINFRGDLLSTGFTLLDTWEVAAPILSYTTLARDVGDDEDRAGPWPSCGRSTA
jgi:hypothetical protein